jgi:glycosyltransferase involved in cell wall biosynthesis
VPPFVRLGVYSDLKYRRDDGGLSTDRAFIRFVTSLPPRVEEVVIFGRLDPEAGRYPYALPTEDVRFVGLPFYPKVTALRGLVSALRRSAAIYRAELDRLDAVWIFGPHPLSDRFARIARRHGTPLVLGVRQDYPSYIGNRLPSRLWGWAIPVAHGLERSFRRLGQQAPTVALGAEIAANYSGGAPVLTTGFSLVRRDELVSGEEALAKPWDGPLRVLSVGRLDPEKNPLLLVEIAELLRKRDPRWSLAIAGDGPLHEAIERRIAERGLSDAVELLGYVPNGPELWAEYRRSHAFLHVSLTEGLPQVLFEAQGAGLPVVATDVGGVSAAVGGGESALLVPPEDAAAAAEALMRIAADEPERRRLIAAGLANAREQTIEAQLDRIAEFLRAAVAQATK